jgi:hypothetical protein
MAIRSLLMTIKGPKSLVKRAQFVSDLLNIQPRLTMKWTKERDSSSFTSFGDGSFVVEIQDWLNGRELIETIGHELVHVWQCLRGDFSNFDDDNRWLWKGKMYSDSNTMDEYFLRPWEMEARAYEHWIEWRWRNR